MKFSEMPYARPNTDELKQKLTELVGALKAAPDFAAAEKVFLEKEAGEAQTSTTVTLAYIRHSIDMAEEFYAAEQKYADEMMPELEEYLQNWTVAILESPFRPDFEKKYGSVMFINAELQKKTFSPEIIPELQRENALVTEYNDLIASAQVNFEGGVYTLSQLKPFEIDPDDKRRLAAWQAEGNFCNENAERLDAIFDELTHLRDSMGKKLGFGGYTGLGYCRMSRNCYDKDDLSRFREAVQKYVVPLADRLSRKQAKRIGKPFPMNFADNALTFLSGNPKPCVDAQGILDIGKDFYHELSPETAEFIDFMFNNELMDVMAKTGKAGGGYCTVLPQYKSPFIFSNFNGTSGDVEVITHEAGHAFQSYIARDIVPFSNQDPSAEACEVHSMSMEFFSWPYAKRFFGEDARKFLYAHLADMLTFIPYGTQVDHFQHIVYEKPDMTPEERHKVWRELTALYMPWLRLDSEIPFFGDGKRWQRQQHIYDFPFYYIDYCLAETVALQLWAMMQKDNKAAWDTYMKYTRLAGTKTFTELVAAAGLESPFGDAALHTVCTAAAEWLDNFDMTGIK